MHNYQATDKMAELIGQEYSLLQVMSRFGIPLGVGDKSVDEVCKGHGVDTDTFLAVLNFVGNGCNHRFIAPPESLSLPSLMTYLKEAHTYFLQFNFPSIRRKLIDAIGSGGPGQTAVLIIQYFDKYVDEVRDHFRYEDNTVFPYVELLLSHTPSNYDTTLNELTEVPVNITITAPDGMETFVSSVLNFDSKINKDITLTGEGSVANMKLIAFPSKKFNQLGKYTVTFYRKTPKYDNYGMNSLTMKVVPLKK